MPSPHIKMYDVPRFESVVDAVRKAWRDAKRGKYRLRDLALVTILAFTGCRLGEALKLRVEDLDVRNRVVRIHQEKKRGTFIRTVPVPIDLFWDIVGEYLKTLPFRDSKLFTVSDRQARNIVYEFSKRYLGRRIRPHAFRHSYATYVLKKVRDLEIVRRLLGHETYAVIKAYLNYTQEDLEQVLEETFRDLDH